MSALVLVNRRYTCRNSPQQSLIQISFSSQSGHSQILIRRAVVGRFLPFAAFWIDSLHCTNMLQCDRRESAMSGRKKFAPASGGEAT